jgi:hypothetical protein
MYSPVFSHFCVISNSHSEAGLPSLSLFGFLAFGLPTCCACAMEVELLMQWHFLVFLLTIRVSRGIFNVTEILILQQTYLPPYSESYQVVYKMCW